MSLKRVLITTGDVDGIGLEVTAKALLSLCKKNKLRDVQILFFYSSKSEVYWFNKLQKTLSPKIYSDIKLALQDKNSPLIGVLCDKSPALWVEIAAKLATQKKIAAIVTAPLSKTEIKKANISGPGHTEILKRISKSKSVFMCFLGEKFNVFLATGHLPIKQVESALLKEKQLLTAINSCLKLKRRLKDPRPIAVLGLNPHAGDSGLIGDFETKRLLPLLKKFSSKQVQGPLVPDAAFVPQQQKKYSFFLALYHDQGLIPFKAVHGYDSGVHISAGLPFLRTSVDHGTAKDIFGKRKANHNSMLLALEYALEIELK